MKIDRRKKYLIVVDTETANTIQNPGDSRPDMSNVLVYDCGWQIIDKKGNVYLSRSYVIREIFIDERVLMRSAYYGKKVPQYVNDIRAGKRILASVWEVRRQMLADMETFGIDVFTAHNASFDWRSLNLTVRYVSKSFVRYWLPYGTEVWDSLKMVRSVLFKMPSYVKFCEKHGYLTKQGKPRGTAEIVWRFIKKDPKFREAHTGLEDVEIEAQIIAYCFRQKKAMDKVLYPGKADDEMPTDLQRQIMRVVRKNPTIRIGKGVA